MVEMDEVERAIVEKAKEISACAEKENWSNKLWTQNLLRAIGALGHSQDFYVCGNYCQEYGQSGWLYDLVWLKREPATKAILDVALILESEWSTNYMLIDDDFQKLLVGRAQHRVMIFQHRDVPRILEALVKQVRTFSRTEPGDRYLLLGWHFTKQHNEWNTELFVA